MMFPRDQCILNIYTLELFMKKRINILYEALEYFYEWLNDTCLNSLLASNHVCSLKCYLEIRTQSQEL